MFKYIIVDDEALIRQGIIKQLEPLHDVALCAGEAKNGQEAIALIESLHPSIAIVDMQMPIMAGTQLLAVLTKQYPDIQIIVISGYKDFDYAMHALSANAIDYVLKPFSNSQIQKAVLEAIRRLEDASEAANRLLSVHKEKEQAFYECDKQILRDLILGFHNEPATQISSKKLAFLRDGSPYFLITINASIPIAKIHIQDYLDGCRHGHATVFFNHPNNLYLGHILLSLTESTPLRDLALCKQILDFLSSLFHHQSIHAHFGISQIHNGLPSLSTAFEQCCKALNAQNPYVDQTYCFFETEPIPLTIDWNKANELLFRLEAGMEKEVQELLQELLEYYLLIPDITLGDIKLHLYGLTNQCWPILEECAKQYKPSISMEQIVKSIFDANELIAYYSSFFTNLARALRECGIYEGADDVIDKIKIYLSRNYQKVITTEIISSYFYINASYFSFLFHQKTGEKFIDYLNGIRIEKAKEMLLHTNYKISTIAKSAGYHNVKYFFRIFKKRERLSPEEFRRNFQK